MGSIVVAMSGGVDSSVAAWLLRETGHDVMGLFIRHGWGCCGLTDARRVAKRLGMPFCAVSYEQEFDRIVDYFVEQYTAGRTPNPCIVCNTRLKFGKLLEYAEEVGAEFVATGHYARLLPNGDGQIALCRGRDASKDQSYVLFGIGRRLLPRLKFPLGEHRKQEIRRIAHGLGLPAAERRESQDICFVPDGDYARFVKQHHGGVDTSGEIVTTDGVVVGQHAGLEHFTVGQRKGLRIAFGRPRYVVRIEPDTRRIVIGTREQLARRELTAAAKMGIGPLFVSDHSAANTTNERKGDLSPFSLRCQVQIRYRSRPADATVTALAGERFHVEFDEPCYGVAPGQAVVCYNGDRVLGGGWIE